MLRLTFATVLMLGTASHAWSLGWESFGNAPFTNVRNYADWPNVMPVINDTYRVYHSWVNGNEHFYFAGYTPALNAALKNFAAIQAEGLTIVLRPGPGKGGSFNNERSFAFNWKLHLLGGISKKIMTRDELGDNIWDPSPYMHVFVGDAIRLDELEIPEGVELLDIADLQIRYAKCLASSDRTVRGWSCSHIAKLDPYNPDAMRKIVGLLDDHDNWVKLNAVGALSLFTGMAGEIVGKLQAVATDDERLQKRIHQTIESLQKAQPDEADRKDFQQTLTSIHTFVLAHRKEIQGR